MNQNKITFESEKLTLDYIAFNLKHGKTQMQQISEHFHFYYQFDAYSVDHAQYQSKSKYKSKKDFLVDNKPYHFTFALNTNPVNRNTISIQFSGENARYFYKLLKTGTFSWEVFNLSDLTLGRIDISYIRNKEINDYDFQSFNLFLRASIHKFLTRYPNAHVKPLINNNLGFGTRTGDYFLRIYKNKDNFLKFELEIKKTQVKQYGLYFFHLSESFLDLEDSISKRFYKYLKIALVLDTSYTDWLVFKLRRTQKPFNSLVSNYIRKSIQLKKTSYADQKYFYRIIQFLSFSRNSNFQKEVLNGQVYYTFNFFLIDFAKKIGFNKQTYTHYQRKQLISFFQNLPKFSPLFQWFSDSEFRSALAFPVVIIENQSSHHTKLIVKISVVEEFCQLNYPFSFPKDFFIFQNKDDLRVKLAILNSFSNQKSIRKEFHLENFLNQFTNSSNQRQSSVKKNIVQQFHNLQQASFISLKLTLYQKNKSVIETEKLTISLIRQTHKIIFYEIIH